MNITFSKDNPKYIDIFDSIARDINEGILKGGERLPSKRDLAISLNVSLNTIMNAYELLLEEGYIYAVEKKGYFVEKQLVVNVKPKEITYNEEARKKPLYDFTTQNLEGFTSTIWRRLIKEELYKEDYVNKTEPSGNLGLRIAIANHLKLNRGIDADPACIVIGSGMEMLEHILISTGINHISLENPGYKKIETITRNSHFTIEHLNIDESGVIVPKVQTILYTTPFNQFPTGIKMSITRKKELISFAKETCSYIIEDDFDAEFRINATPSVSLYSLCPENVIFFSTFTETLYPGLRISFTILPKTLLKEYQDKYTGYSSSVPTLDQLVLRDFISGGYYESVINKTKRRYLKKRELILSLLKESKHLRCDSKKNYLSILIKLNTEASDVEIKKRLKEKGISIQMLSDFDKDNKDSHTLILGYTSIPYENIPKGIEYLIAAIENK